MSGKLVFTIATTDVMERVQEAKADGSFVWEYGAAPLPDINKEVCTRGISVTNGIAVNGYSKKRSEADAFSSWLSTEGAAKLYDRTGHVAALQTAASQNGEMAAFWQEYQRHGPDAQADEHGEFLGADGSGVHEDLAGRKCVGRIKGSVGSDHDAGDGRGVYGTGILELPKEPETGFEEGAMD